MEAKLLYQSKIYLLHKTTEDRAVAELKVWEIPPDKNYPEGIKYSMFLADLSTAEVVVGLDNHKPKRHHLHIDGYEKPYDFVDVERLIEDFWNYAEQKGYTI